MTLVSGVPDVVDPNMPFSFDLSATVSGADPSISQCTSNVTWTWAIASVEYSSDNVTWGAAPVGGSYALMIVGSSDPSDSSATLMGEFSPPGYYAVQLTASVSNTGTDCSGPWNGSDTEYVGGPDTGATGGGGSGAAYRYPGATNRLAALLDGAGADASPRGSAASARVADWLPSTKEPQRHLVQSGGNAPPDEILVPGNMKIKNPTATDYLKAVEKCASTWTDNGPWAFFQCLLGSFTAQQLKNNAELIVCSLYSLANTNPPNPFTQEKECIPWGINLVGPCEMNDLTHCQDCCEITSDWCTWTAPAGVNGCTTAQGTCIGKCDAQYPKPKQPE